MCNLFKLTVLTIDLIWFGSAVEIFNVHFMDCCVSIEMYDVLVVLNQYEWEHDERIIENKRKKVANDRKKSNRVCIGTYVHRPTKKNAYRCRPIDEWSSCVVERRTNQNTNNKKKYRIYLTKWKLSIQNRIPILTAIDSSLRIVMLQRFEAQPNTSIGDWFQWTRIHIFNRTFSLAIFWNIFCMFMIQFVLCWPTLLDTPWSTMYLIR